MASRLTNNRIIGSNILNLVGGGEMIVILIAAIVALPIAWGLKKLDDYINGYEVVFEMEDEDKADR